MAGKKTEAKKSPSNYNKFQKAAGNYCKNPSATNATRLKNAEKRYAEGAIKKGKTKAEVKTTVSKVKKCKR